jgi:hypothetical protein
VVLVKRVEKVRLINGSILKSFFQTINKPQNPTNPERMGAQVARTGKRSNKPLSTASYPELPDRFHCLSTAVFSCLATRENPLRSPRGAANIQMKALLASPISLFWHFFLKTAIKQLKTKHLTGKKIFLPSKICIS